MHRSQALSGAFTMRRARGAAARNGAVSERLNAGKLIFVVCDSARGGTSGPCGQLLPRARTGLSRARYGAVPGTDDQPLSDRTGPAGRVLTTEHVAGEPLEPETCRGAMVPAVCAEPLADRAPATAKGYNRMLWQGRASDGEGAARSLAGATGEFVRRERFTSDSRPRLVAPCRGRRAP